MSLYGALFASVAGLNVQSNKIGAISDNIANVNTVGYKETTASFETLVTSSGLTSSFNPGGVLSQTQSQIGQQGQIQGTSSNTDIAISGNGFFVVKDGLTSSASTLYTRAGSFTQDSLGNFINSAGFFLQGWPLDRNGNLPGAPGNANTNSANNLSSLQTVNVVSASGNAAGTTTVALSANLKASQTIFPGAGATATMDIHGINFAQPAASIIIPDVLNGTVLPSNEDSIQRGDKFGVALNGTTANAAQTSPLAVYTYGGFTYGRSVNTGANGDSGTPVQLSPLTLGTTPFTTSNGSPTVSVNAPNTGLQNGDVITLSGNSAIIGGIPAADFNGQFVVSNASATGFNITVAASATSGATGGTTGVAMVTRPFVGNILDASTETATFLGTTGTSSFTPAGLTFTITTAASGTVTFTYTAGSPNPQLQQFNTLDNLATAINTVTGLTARVSNGRLFVAATDANAAVTFADGGTTGNSGPPVQGPIDWVEELGLQNIASSINRFNSLQSLASAVNATTGLAATVTNPLNNATLSINATDPLATIEFADPAQPAALGNTVSFTTSPQSSSSSTTVTFSSPALPSTAKTGDLVKINPTTFAGYPAPFNATGQIDVSTAAGNPVTIHMVGNTIAVGQIAYIDPSQLTGYPNGTLNGIPLTDLKGDFVAQAGTDATHLVIDVASPPTANALGIGSGTLLVSPTFGGQGLPLTALNGQFPITVSGGTFSINVPFFSSLETGSTLPGLTPITVTAPTNNGSMLAALGLGTSASLLGVAYNPASPETLGPIGPQYNPTDPTKNMAGGTIVPQFSQDVRVFDSLGSGHDIKVSFIKTATNTWAVELYALNASEVSPTFPNGLLASGTLSFNGDGSLRSVSAGLSAPVAITWTDGASASSITYNWGTAGALGTGKTDGISQFDAAYAINFINQNGTAVGQLTSVTVTSQGFVVANFNNGQSQKLYQLPLAVFSAPDHLQSQSGNVFSQTNASGSPNLRQAGTSGAGTFDPSALETSTVDLASELTSLIVAQRAYEANTKLVTIADTLLNNLNQAIQG